jgi:hypothetical protein
MVAHVLPPSGRSIISITLVSSAAAVMRDPSVLSPGGSSGSGTVLALAVLSSEDARGTLDPGRFIPGLMLPGRARDGLDMETIAFALVRSTNSAFMPYNALYSWSIPNNDNNAPQNMKISQVQYMFGLVSCKWSPPIAVSDYFVTAWHSPTGRPPQWRRKP